MHEFSICERIVDAVLSEIEQLQRPSFRLCTVRVVVGGLHQIVPDYLSFAYDVLTRDTAAAGSELQISVNPVIARCRSCNWEGEIDLPIFRCAACQSLNLDMLRGKELYLEHLEVEDGPAATAPAVEKPGNDSA